MQNNSLKTGRDGEDAAIEHLLQLGYEILERNWRFRRLEVDIIAQKGEGLVFVEVKTRHGNAFGEPELFVSDTQQARLVEAAQHYLELMELQTEARFDIIAITLSNTGSTLKHLEGAFFPGIG